MQNFLHAYIKASFKWLFKAELLFFYIFRVVISFDLHVRSSDPRSLWTISLYDLYVRSLCHISIYDLYLRPVFVISMYDFYAQFLCRIYLYDLFVRSLCTISLYDFYVRSQCPMSKYDLYIRSLSTMSMYDLFVRSLSLRVDFWFMFSLEKRDEKLSLLWNEINYKLFWICRFYLY